MASRGNLGDVEALATRVKELIWVVLDSVPADLVEWSLMLVRLLQAVDTFPRGGMYDGHYALQAALRYELFWLPLASRTQASRKPLLVPPLDVAMAWLLHRCSNPGLYPMDCHVLTGRTIDPPPAQAFRFAGSHAYSKCESLEERQAWASREVWDDVYVYGNGLSDIGGLGASGGVPRLGTERNRDSEVATLPANGGGVPKASGPAEASGSGSSGQAQGSKWARSRHSIGSRGGGTDSDGGRAGTRAGAKERAEVSAAEGTAAADPPAAQATAPGRKWIGNTDLKAPYWPPAPPGSLSDLTCRWLTRPSEAGANSTGGSDDSDGGGDAAPLNRGRLGWRLAARMSLLRPLLHSLLRPAYLDPDVLTQAIQRYCRFLMLQGMHPSTHMVPTTDIALMWVTHMAVPDSYRNTCRRLLGRVLVPGPGVLQLQEGSSAFVETQRLYEHHFGEVYDPPLVRAVPLSTLHPLMSTPLAPFLAAYDVGSPPPLPLNRTSGGGAAAGDISSGRLPHNTASASEVEGGHRCGAHALYLAYLMRRGSKRSAKSLLGLVLGQGHRRRAAVRYVANKAASFRDFLHLPHSDCHVYWDQLCLRHVDPDSVSANATPTPTQSGSQPDETSGHVRQLNDLEQDLYGASDIEGEGHRRRQRQAGVADEEGRSEGEERVRAGSRPVTLQLPQRREDSRREVTPGSSRAPTPTAAVAASRRMSWVDPVGGVSTPRQQSVSSPEDSFDGGPPPALQAPGPRRGSNSGGARQKAKRIALIIPLPHTSLTVPVSRNEAVNRWLSGPDTPLVSARCQRPEPSASGLGDGSHRGGTAAAVEGQEQPTATIAASQGADGGPGATMFIHMAGMPVPAPTAAAPPPPSVASSDADSSAELVPSTEVRAADGPSAAPSAVALERGGAWAAPRAQVEREQQQQLQAQSQQQQKPPKLHDQSQQQQLQQPSEQGQLLQHTWYGPAAGLQEGELMSPLSPPPFVRHKNEDGTEEWAYNNPHYDERSSQMGPLSPTGQTPPPASAAYLAAAAAPRVARAQAEASGAYAAVQDSKPAAQGRGPAEDSAAIQEVLANDSVCSPSADATVGVSDAATVIASSDKDRIEGVQGPAHPRAASRASESGPPSAGGSAYLSCAASRTSLTDIDPDAPAASVTSSDGSQTVYGTPSAAFAASVVTPFTLVPDGDTASASGSDAYAASNIQDGTPSAAMNAGLLAAADAAAGAGGGDSRGGPPRFSGPSPSRLARVTKAAGQTSMPAPSLPPVTPLRSSSATSATVGPAPHAIGTGSGASMTASRSVSGIPRPQSGLPPRPTLARASGSATSGAAPGTAGCATRRATGGYSLSDVSYMSGLGGGLASLVAGGDESPAFSMSLRERYSRGAGGGGGSSNSAGAGAGAGLGGDGRAGSVAGASRGSSAGSGGSSRDGEKAGGGLVADRRGGKGAGGSGGASHATARGGNDAEATSSTSKGSAGGGSISGPKGWRR